MCWVGWAQQHIMGFVLAVVDGPHPWATVAPMSSVGRRPFDRAPFLMHCLANNSQIIPCMNVVAQLRSVS